MRNEQLKHVKSNSFLLFCFWFNVFSTARLYNVWWKVHCERWHGEDVEGNGHGL